MDEDYFFDALDKAQEAMTAAIGTLTIHAAWGILHCGLTGTL